MKALSGGGPSVGGGGGAQPPRPEGARGRGCASPPPPPPTHFHASGRRFTHNSSGQSKNPLTAITVPTATKIVILRRLAGGRIQRQVKRAFAARHARCGFAVGVTCFT